MTVATQALFAQSLVKPVRRRARRFWKRYIRWPAPVWRLRGYAWLDLAGHKFKFHVANRTVWWTRQVAQGRWERSVREFLAQVLQPGDVFVDVGAWTGIYTLLGSKLVTPAGQVYAFEPDPVARRVLERNLAMNHARNVRLVPAAVSDREGWIAFDAGEGSSEGRLTRSEGTIRVPTVALDAFCAQENAHPSVIKITAMGAEPTVLAGGSEVVGGARVIVLHFQPLLLREAGFDPCEFFQSLFNLGKRVVMVYEMCDQARPLGTELTGQSAITDYMKLALMERS
jgi:FkbM family methyltransferase